MSNASASGRRPPELDDPEWLRAQYERHGDLHIALDLHVSRKTVRLARERLGIPSLPPGRRPQPASVKPDARKPRIVKITSRKARFEREGEPPSRESVLRRLVEWDHAIKDRNVTGQINALEAMAAAAWRLADHLEQAHAA